ncbi:MAG: secondary thiamine-phosphate synthase enzyme [Chloroflexi bacterium RBG_16_54_18]|nr:MAG: secondary thiamine-phosphate synthase enzyme [Chloroflexi bacterium RBG_16_54_18]
MTAITSSIRIASRGDADIQDITAQIAECVKGSGLQNGIVCVFCPSSTSALTTIEFENGCLSDLRRVFDEIVPPEKAYQHNVRWDDGNGHSHVRAAMLGASLTIPFVKTRLTLGTWQQVIFVDFDNRPRQRELVVQILGE